MEKHHTEDYKLSAVMYALIPPDSTISLKFVKRFKDFASIWYKKNGEV